MNIPTRTVRQSLNMSKNNKLTFLYFWFTQICVLTWYPTTTTSKIPTIRQLCVDTIPYTWLNTVFTIQYCILHIEKNESSQLLQSEICILKERVSRDPPDFLTEIYIKSMSQDLPEFLTEIYIEGECVTRSPWVHDRELYKWRVCHEI